MQYYFSVCVIVIPVSEQYRCVLLAGHFGYLISIYAVYYISSHNEYRLNKRWSLTAMYSNLATVNFVFVETKCVM